MIKKRILKILTIIILICLTAFILISSLMAYRSHTYYKLGEIEFDKGNHRDAAAYYETSIRHHSLWKKPGMLSTLRMKQMAELLESQRRWKEAAYIYQTLLSALSSIQTGYSSNKKEIDFLIIKVDEVRRKISAQTPSKE